MTRAEAANNMITTFSHDLSKELDNVKEIETKEKHNYFLRVISQN